MAPPEMLDTLIRMNSQGASAASPSVALTPERLKVATVNQAAAVGFVAASGSLLPCRSTVAVPPAGDSQACAVNPPVGVNIGPAETVLAFVRIAVLLISVFQWL